MHSEATSARKSRVQLPNWVIYLLFAGFVMLVVSTSLFTFSAVRRVVGGLPPGPGKPTPIAGDGTGNQPGISDPIIDGQIPGIDTPISITDRLTVLVMGIDERESEEGPWRTDTMILLTIDPATNTAGMLSIPRDVWVEIPDYGGLYDRVNNAHFRGDADNYPGGGGPALALKTVRHNFGIPVNYYITVNFNAFTDVIGYLGCVPITVYETIDDPDYPEADGPGYDPLYLEAGDYCMEGDLLLKYARTRATFGGDFDRADRQQQVIRAIRDHVLSTDQLPGLIAQAPNIYNDVEANISTNLNITQIVDLARLGAQVPDDAICSAVIDGAYVDLFTLPSGDQVLVPDPTQIRGLVQDIFTGTGRCLPGG